MSFASDVCLYETETKQNKKNSWTDSLSPSPCHTMLVPITKIRNQINQIAKEKLENMASFNHKSSKENSITTTTTMTAAANKKKFSLNQKPLLHKWNSCTYFQVIGFNFRFVHMECVCISRSVNCTETTIKTSILSLMYLSCSRSRNSMEWKINRELPIKIEYRFYTI